MTKIQLLAIAQQLQIVGRHDMTRDALEVLILEAWSTAKHYTNLAARERAIIPETDETLVLEPSDQPVLPADEVLAPSRQTKPWVRKFYYVNAAEYSAAKESGELSKAPLQVQLMLKSMVVSGYTSADQSKQGGDVVQRALQLGHLATRIDPPALFAYYRKRMEGLGLTLA